MEEKMTKLICRSNSTIVQWEIVGHSSSAITQSDIKKGFTIRTIGGADGVLHSALTVNTSLYSTRLGMWRVRCFNEKMITGQFICIQYNGRCMNEVSCDYHDSTVIESSITSSNIPSTSVTEDSHKTSAAVTPVIVAVVSCALLVIGVLCCITLSSIGMVFHTKFYTVRRLSNKNSVTRDSIV